MPDPSDVRERLTAMERSLRVARASLSARDAALVTLRTDLEAMRASRDAMHASREAVRDDQERLQNELTSQIAEVDARIAAALADQRVAFEAQIAAATQQAADAGRSAEARVATMTVLVADLRGRLEVSEEAAGALARYADSAGFRLVTAVSSRLRRFSLIYVPLRHAVRSLARFSSRGRSG